MFMEVYSGARATDVTRWSVTVAGFADGVAIPVHRTECPRYPHGRRCRTPMFTTTRRPLAFNFSMERK